MGKTIRCPHEKTGEMRGRGNHKGNTNPIKIYRVNYTEGQITEGIRTVERISVRRGIRRTRGPRVIPRLTDCYRLGKRVESAENSS